MAKVIPLYSSEVYFNKHVMRKGNAMPVPMPLYDVVDGELVVMKPKKNLPHYRILFQGSVVYFHPLNRLAEEYVNEGNKNFYFK